MKKIIMFSMLSLIIGFSIGLIYPKQINESVSKTINTKDKSMYNGIVNIRAIKHFDIMMNDLHSIQGVFNISYRANDSSLFITESDLAKDLRNIGTPSETGVGTIYDYIELVSGNINSH